VPISEVTAQSTVDYKLPSPFSAYPGFSVVFKCTYKVDPPCKILPEPGCTLDADLPPGWDIVSGPTSTCSLTKCTSTDVCTSRDGVHCQGDVTLALFTPSVWTPFGSVGSFKIPGTNTHVHIDMLVCADGSITNDKRVNGTKVP
jgi:hypothetical protein